MCSCPQCFDLRWTRQIHESAEFEIKLNHFNELRKTICFEFESLACSVAPVIVSSP
jgi:hypothetical protein